MNSYEEIKQLLEQKKFQSALLVAFSNSLKFKLTSEITNQQESSCLETEIDLLKGLTTKTSRVEILKNDNNLIKFHTQQLENIYEIWNQNRQILITIFNILAGNEISSLDELQQKPLSFNNSSTIESKRGNEVNEIVDLMLEENEDNHHIESADNGENWLDETKDMIISAEKQPQAEASWNEFMDDLSAEEEAVTEEVIVDNVSPDEEIDDNWSEWLDDDSKVVDVDNEEDDDDEEDDDLIDWSKEEEVIK